MYRVDDRVRVVIASVSINNAEYLRVMTDDAAVADTVWVEYFTDTNKSYFFNKETKQTTWKVPSDYLAWKEAALKAYLKTTNWKKAADKKDKFYYYDKVTKVTQWEVPADVIDFEMGLLKANLQRYEMRKRKAKDITADSKDRTQDAVPSRDEVAKDVISSEATVSLSKIRKRVAEVDDEYESNNNDDLPKKNLPTAVPTEGRFGKESGAKNRVTNNDYTDSDHEEHYSQDADDFKGDGNLQDRSSGEKEIDNQTVSKRQKVQDVGTASLDNDGKQTNDDDGDRYRGPQKGDLTPEQKSHQNQETTPQFQESTPQGTPQFQESTPQGTPQYQESTPQGTLQFQESTPQGTPQYQESTPQGTPQYQESTPQGTADNEYGGYGNDDENKSLNEKVGHSSKGKIQSITFSVSRYNCVKRGC